MAFCWKHPLVGYKHEVWYLPPTHGCQNLERWSEQTGYLAAFFQLVVRSLPQSQSVNNFSRIHVQQMKATSIGVSFLMGHWLWEAGAIALLIPSFRRMTKLPMMKFNSIWMHSSMKHSICHR